MTIFEGRIENAHDAKTMILAGKANFTLVGQSTRFTYKVEAPSKFKGNRGTGIRFVRVMTGPDNNTSYTYAGFLKNGKLVTGGKARIKADAQSMQAFAWAWERISRGVMPGNMEVWHSGECAKCGRKLTVPESVGRGIGPVCIGRLG